MKVAIYLLISLACGSGLYAAAAVIWSMLDPDGAGRALLFTIPIAVVTMAVMGLLAAVALVLPFEPEAKRAPARAPATPVPAAHQHHEEPELVLAA